ncbi:MAG: PAS domain S-box protein [Spirochaetia bacterium]
MSKKILLVEDEALIAMNEAAILTETGYKVITAYNAQKAVDAVRKEEIDLVLMDIDLGRGRMDGTEAAQIILEEKDVPIVFLSSHTEPEVVEKTEGITSYGYIVKNSGETVLLASIKMAFRLYDAHMELKRQKEHLNTALVKYEQTAEELAEKSVELDRYFTSSLDMLCIADTEGEFIRLNPEWEKVLGYSVSELEGRPFIDFVHENDREATLQAVAQLDAQEEVTSFENRFRCKDGSYRWIEWRSTPIGTKIYAAARDITERKQTEEDLLEREALYRNLMENSIDGVELLDEYGRFLNVNERECEMTGYSRAELLRMSIADIDPNYPADGFYRFWNEKPKGSSFLFETIHRHKDGTLIPVEVNGIFFKVNDKKYIYGVARDITERRQAEREIRAKEENLRTTLKSIGDGVISTDAEGQVTWMNPVAERLCGWKEEDAKGIPLEKVFTIINANTRKAADNPVEKVMRSGSIVGLANHTVLVSKQGTEYQIADSAAPIRDDSGGIDGVVLVFRDVTEDYSLRSRIEESERLLTNVFDAVQAGISVLSRDLSILRVNRWIEEKHGNRNSFAGKKCYEVYQKRSKPCTNCPSVLALAGGTPRTKEVEVPTGDGETFWSEITAYPMKDENGTVTGVVEYVSDITRWKHAAAELKSALLKKDFLMKELNHRVKNNLNMVSSLIRLKDEESEEDLSGLVHRIDAISLVHEKLHQHDDIEHIEVKEYFQKLLQSVFSFTADRKVHIVNTIEDVSIPVKAAIPLGLIVNEIATNAIKYGFTEDEEARFIVTLTEDEDNDQYTLTLSNTGRQFPEEIDIDGAKTLGLQLVSALVVQLQGTLELKRKPHPVFTITFPMESDVI